MAGVRLDRVRKVYDNGHVAVHGATFEVRDGEFLVLVGPSGCGKTTMLRLIAGLEEITDGEIYIGDRRVNDVSPKERDIAMVFQNYALYPHMTVYDNMAFGLKLRKYKKAEIVRRVEETAAILGIEDLLDRKPKQLSGGQRQRIAVGRAIVRNPQVFLFDEPLSNLDARLRVQMRSELTKLHRRLGATMIYVTHDQVEAMTMGQRIVVLHDGHVQQIDTPMRLYEEPVNRFVAGFIGSPAMNLVEGVLERSDGLVFRAGAGGWRLPIEAAAMPGVDRRVGEAVVLGIRPEDVYLVGSPYVRNPTAEVEMELDVAELMGNEAILHARDGAHSFVARVAPHDLPAPGDALRLAFDLTKIHFFDAVTGRRLGVGASETALAAREGKP